MGVSSFSLIPTLLFLQVASNPLTTSKLLLTILFQVGFLGGGVLIGSRYLVPLFYKLEGRAMRTPIKARRVWMLMLAYLPKGVAFILLTGTLGILLTDVGWAKAFARYTPGLALLLARASGAPNGAHLLSYIPLPLLGLYVAIKYRRDVMLDCYQGIMVVAFGVAVHESIWLVAYWSVYAQFWNLGVLTNVLEDFFFLLMCSMFIVAFWKYPYRTIPMKVFKWPILIYSWFMVWWWTQGVPVSTINNWQIGMDIYGSTKWWADPWVNGIEIMSWVMVAALFFVAIWHENKKVRT